MSIDRVFESFKLFGKNEYSSPKIILTANKSQTYIKAYLKSHFIESNKKEPAETLLCIFWSCDSILN